MLRRLALLPVFVLLSACQSPQINHDFDASRDFGAYRSWAWKEPGVQYRPDDPRIKSDLTDQRIRQAVSGQLDQRGLRPTAAGGRADVQLQAYLIIDNRQQQVTTNYGGGWGGGYWGPYWASPMMNETRSVDYQVATLQLDMVDGRDGKLVWRGSTEQVVNDNAVSPTDRNAAIQKAVAKILSTYPPR